MESAFSKMGAFSQPHYSDYQWKRFRAFCIPTDELRWNYSPDGNKLIL